MEMPCFGLPLGEADFKRQSRVAYLLDLARKTRNARMLVELKGDSIEPDGWVREFHQVFAKVGGQMCWHPSPKLTRKMVDGEGNLTPELQLMAHQADHLRREFGLLAVTIHLMPAIAQEPEANAGLERYNSPIGPEEMLSHLKSQVKPLKHLNKLTGGILNIETVDITNFRGGTRLPTYLALQTGAWMDIVWLRDQTGVRITADSEHMLCAGNLLMRRRDLKDVPRWLPFTIEVEIQIREGERYVAEDELYQIAGYWLNLGQAPLVMEKKELELPEHLQLLKPHLYHFGGAVQANLNGTIGTHLPYDEGNAEQMAILDLQLEMIKKGQGIGGVVEVVGQLDPAKYDPWSPRIADDEEAKRHTLEVLLKRWDKISG